MDKCPICGQKVTAYHEVSFKEPFVHNHPYDGIMIYGAYSAPKETICFKDNYLHFAFYDANGELVQDRLVKLDVESPTTPRPSADLADPEEEDDERDDEDDYWGDNDEAYYPGQFDYDDEEFPHGSLDY